MNIDNRPRIFIVIDGKKIAPINLEPEKILHDKQLMDAYNTLKKREIQSHYENENGTITLSIQNDIVYLECSGFNKETTLFLTSLFGN